MAPRLVRIPDPLRLRHLPARLLAAAIGVITTIALAVTIVGVGPAAAAQPTVGLGTAASFAVLGGQTVTNTGASVISGDVGVSPGTAVTGFPPGRVNNGTFHRADAVARSAQADLTTAYNDAAGRTPVTSVPADLAGLTLTAGVYGGPTLGLTGTVTLNAQGDPNAVFIFTSMSTLITASSSVVALTNGAQACNVFWQVGSSATLGTNSTFVGTILALTSITAQTGATIQGRLLARIGAVTLDRNTITRPICTTQTTSSSTTSSSSSGTTSSSTTSSSTTSSSTTTSTTSSSTTTSTSPSNTSSSTTTPPGAGTPTVAGLSPTSGPTGGGTSVTVTGTGFVPGQTSVTIGGVVIPASMVSVTSSMSLSFVTPAHASGAVNVTVTTARGTSAARTFTYQAAATSLSTTSRSSTTTAGVLPGSGAPHTGDQGGANPLLLGGIALAILAAASAGITMLRRRAA